MKKNTVTSILIFIVICTVVVVVNRYMSLATSSHRTEEKLSSSQREIIDLRRLMTVNDNVIDETINQLNAQINDYEFIIKKWSEFDLFNDLRLQLAMKSYDVEAIVHTAEGSFPLPKNGLIIVDSDYVELEINIVKPPNVRNDDINTILHLFDNIYTGFSYNFYDSEAEHFEDEDTIRIKYTNLENNDTTDVFVNNNLLRLLELQSSNIKILITDEFPSSKEYLPTKIKTKQFSYGLLNSKFSHQFTYLSDNAWIVDIDELDGDRIFKIEYDGAAKIKYEYEDGLKITEISRDGEIFEPYERVILPNVIKLGESWQDQSRVGTITSVNLQLLTTFGILDTFEVTYSKDGINEGAYYYAKGYGIVHMKLADGECFILDVKYYK